ncbi:MAG: cytotoxin [Deltaproteobacteria bacterium]|nr:cytotoxin [Deltaproteobacteria bacterium]
MKIYRSDRFKKSYGKLPDRVRNRFHKQILLFIENQKHRSLRTRRIVNTPYREFRVDLRYRVIFRPYEDGFMLLDIGPHDIVDAWGRRGRSVPD